jgi:signal transduction histidine kinase
VLWLRAHPRAADLVFALVVAVLTMVAHVAIRDPEFRTPTWWSPVPVALSTVPLAWRRRWPRAVLVVTSLAEFAVQAGNFVGAGFLGVLVAAYTVGAYVSGRRLWITGVLGTAAVGAFIGIGVTRGDADLGALISSTVLFGASFVLGDNMRRRRERATELVERAERAERERELVAHQRVQQERTRIARELHDVVAHSLSVMIIQAGAARRQVSAHPDQAIGSMEAIEATGREAMNEMRRILGVLRSDDEHTDRAPQPSLDSLGDLLAATDDLPIAFTTTGDLTAVPSAVELSAFRVVQEALTNVRRHAGRVDHVEVDVGRHGDQLVVSVIDDGRGAGAARNEPGFGIMGMNERVGMFGGELEAGPRSGGGWRVRATFPLLPAGARMIGHEVTR